MRQLQRKFCWTDKPYGPAQPARRGSATLKVKKGGRYQEQVEVCNASGCAKSASKLIIVGRHRR
ncbi:chitinase N-terminal domain-containing protein [Enterobacter hormaechei]